MAFASANGRGKAVSQFLKPALLVALSGCLLFSVIAADDAVAVPGNDLRIERLAGLGRLWGDIEYFHPFLAYKDIDWDEALLKTIPKINKAENGTDYRRAIEYLLASLKDPNTYIPDSLYAFTPAKISDLPDANGLPSLIWTDDDISIITAFGFQRQYPSDELLAYAGNILPQLAEARGVIFDTRCFQAPKTDEEQSNISRNLEILFSHWLPPFLKDSAYEPSSRYRAYTVNPVTDALLAEENFIYTPGLPLAHLRENRDSLPMVFILNEGSADLLNLLGGLQASHQGAIVYEGYFDREGGIGTYAVDLPDEVRVMMRLTETIKRNGTESVHPDLVIPFITDTTLLDCPPIRLALDIIEGGREVPPPVGVVLSPGLTAKVARGYGETAYHKMEFRLLAMFRIWNEIRFFHPHINDFGSRWDSALTEFIPIFETADTEDEYMTAMARLTGRLHDSNIQIRNKAGESPFGNYFPSFGLEFVDGKTVITKAAKGDAGIEDGDVVLSIDGEDIEQRRARMADVLPASTPQSLQFRENAVLQASSIGKPVSLKLEKKDGRVVDVTAGRHAGRYQGLSGYNRAVTMKFKDDISYIGPGYWAGSKGVNNLDAILESRGLIIDLRGQNQEAFDSIRELLPHFTNRVIDAGRWRTLERHTPDLDKYSWADCKVEIRPAGERPYDGKIMVLIDAGTAGEIEACGLYLKVLPGVTFIGRPSAGSPGQKRRLVLPGEISVEFTGTDAVYPDGRAVYGIGLQPDIEVIPTIDAVRSGKDEILEAAINYLKKSIKH